MLNRVNFAYKIKSSAISKFCEMFDVFGNISKSYRHNINLTTFQKDASKGSTTYLCSEQLFICHIELPLMIFLALDDMTQLFLKIIENFFHSFILHILMQRFV